MKLEDLGRLAERAEGVDGRAADRLDEVHDKITLARRRRVGAVVASAAVVAAVVAGGTAITTMDRSQEPVGPPSPSPTPSEALEIPEGQTTVEAEFGPDDIGGYQLVASRTNAQPGYRGATDLTLIGNEMPWEGVQFCQGDPDTWWVYLVDMGGDGGPRPGDGAMTDGSRASFGTCSTDDPASPQRPQVENDPTERFDPVQSYNLRMFVTRPLSEAAQSCLGTTNAASCLATHGIEPLAETDAIFGFGDFEEVRTAYVLEVFEFARYRAWYLAEDGVEYLIDRAVIAGADADRLVLRLPASNGRRVVGLVERETPAAERCRDDLDIDTAFLDDEELEAFEEHCGTELRLRVDGGRPTDNDASPDGQAFVPAGGEHVVTVDLVKGDPRHVQYAVVIWEER